MSKHNNSLKHTKKPPRKSSSCSDLAKLASDNPNNNKNSSSSSSSFHLDLINFNDVKKSLRSTTKTITKKFHVAANTDAKLVGLGKGVHDQTYVYEMGTIEEHEKKVRHDNKSWFLTRFTTTLIAATLVFFFYLITLETLVSCAISVVLTFYWYEKKETNQNVSGSGMDWVVLGFAVVTPITVTIRMAFGRRERALMEISRLRSCCFQIFQAHALWDWNSGRGRQDFCTDEDWVKCCDQVLDELVGIGDELSRFLTLPTSSRTYHRMLPQGRRKAATIVEVSYRLYDSFYTQRMLKLTRLTETLKAKGMSQTEISRLRQYERFVGESIENLRMIKMYRTPLALRSFGRLFTLLLPPLYAPTFAELAIDLDAFWMGILFAVITPLCLTALFETMQVLEDPFVGWVSLDGIDVTEEMEVLHFHQLMSARRTLFPNAKPYEARTQAAIVTAQPSIMKGGGGGGTSSDPSAISSPLSLATPAVSMDGSTRISHFALNKSEKMTSRRGSLAKLMSSTERGHRRNASHSSVMNKVKSTARYSQSHH